MSAATSPGTGLAYGLQLVCAAWGFARSSFYAMKSRQQASAERAPAKRRGPKPRSRTRLCWWPSRPIWRHPPGRAELYIARSGLGFGSVVASVFPASWCSADARRTNLLLPHRGRRRGGNPHDGEIVTHAPNLMWGTDGVRVFTVDDGWGWIFTAIEHWNAECVGWHVCKRGDRFAALQRSPCALRCMTRPPPVLCLPKNSIHGRKPGESTSPNLPALVRMRTGARTRVFRASGAGVGRWSFQKAQGARRTSPGAWQIERHACA